MDQEKVLRLSMLSILSQVELTDTQRNAVHIHLKCAYAAGYDEGRKQTKHGKAVVQLKDGIEVDSFACLSDAARRMGVDKTSIYKAAKYGIRVKGYEWKYKNNEHGYRIRRDDRRKDTNLHEQGCVRNL